MSKIHRLRDQNGQVVYRAFKAEALRVAKRASRNTDAVIHVERFTLIDMPRLQLVEACLNNHGWHEGSEIIASFQSGRLVSSEGVLEEDVDLSEESEA